MTSRTTQVQKRFFRANNVLDCVLMHDIQATIKRNEHLSQVRSAAARKGAETRRRNKAIKQYNAEREHLNQIGQDAQLGIIGPTNIVQEAQAIAQKMNITPTHLAQHVDLYLKRNKAKRFSIVDVLTQARTALLTGTQLPWERA